MKCKQSRDAPRPHTGHTMTSLSRTQRAVLLLSARTCTVMCIIEHTWLTVGMSCHRHGRKVMAHGFACHHHIITHEVETRNQTTVWRRRTHFSLSNVVLNSESIIVDFPIPVSPRKRTWNVNMKSEATTATRACRAQLGLRTDTQDVEVESLVDRLVDKLVWKRVEANMAGQFHLPVIATLRPHKTVKSDSQANSTPSSWTNESTANVSKTYALTRWRRTSTAVMWRSN